MSDREILSFEHLGYTMIAVATKIDGEWHSRFDLKRPQDAKQYKVSGREGPYASSEEAFEKAKQWARQEIEQLRENIPK